MGLTERLTLECTDTDKGGLTLHELAEFVKRAQDKHVDPDARIAAIVRWRGRIKMIKVEL